MKRMILLHLLFIAAIAQRAHAERVLDHYDLDSLSYLSQTIVRAQVGDSIPFKTVDPHHVSRRTDPFPRRV